jgi:hypothetical protein
MDHARVAHSRGAKFESKSRSAEASDGLLESRNRMHPRGEKQNTPSQTLFAVAIRQRSQKLTVKAARPHENSHGEADDTVAGTGTPR